MKQVNYYDFLCSVQIKKFPLSHFNQRPDRIAIDTIVIHSMYAKDHIRPTSALTCFKILDQNKVSSHYSIDRKGNIWQHVELEERAWHAGESFLPSSQNYPAGRNNVNDFSIGIEMIGVWGQRFTSRQYRNLVKLIIQLCIEFKITTISSHERIAPNRKQDPGPSFRWDIIKRKLSKMKITPQILA